MTTTASGQAATAAKLRLQECGYVVLPTPLDAEVMSELRTSAFRAGHRRVLHVVYHDADPIPEAWHRAV